VLNVIYTLSYLDYMRNFLNNSLLSDICVGVSVSYM